MRNGGATIKTDMMKNNSFSLQESASVRRATLITIVFALLASSASPQAARTIAKKTFPSVVMLLMEDVKRQPISLGSGFFVKRGIVATNRHVILDAYGGHARAVGTTSKFEINGVVAADDKHDLVLLSVQDLKAPSIDLADSRQVQVGDPVFVIGNPLGLEGTISEGIVSGIRTFDGDTLLQITAPISPGSSGGPVLNSEGKVIGVAVATFKGGQNLNFAIPSSYLLALADLMHAPVPLIAAKPKDKSLTEDFRGSGNDAVFGQQFLWDHDKSYGTGWFTFSLRNLLSHPVKDVYCLVIFYDPNGEPIETKAVSFTDTIPPGLARRVDRQWVHGSVQDMTTQEGKRTPSTKVEFRVLDFKIVR